MQKIKFSGKMKKDLKTCLKRGFNLCHISPDWLLIYRQNGEYLELYRTGTHSDLFDE